MTVLSYTQTMAVETCYKCFVEFGMPADMQRSLLKSHDNFWCPNGHQQHYTGKTEEQKLREQVEAQQRNLIWYQNELNSTRKAHASTKGQLTRARKRAANGVCPCCKRTFANVAEHVASQHPDFKNAVG